MVLYISVKYERKMKDFGILQVLLQRLCQISKYQLYLHQTVRLAILYRVIIVPLYTIGHQPKTTVRAEQLLTSYNYEPGIYQINTITHVTSSVSASNDRDTYQQHDNNTYFRQLYRSGSYGVGYLCASNINISKTCGRT